MKRMITAILLMIILCNLTGCSAAPAGDISSNPTDDVISSERFDAMLAEYASVLIDTGLQIQGGETVIIEAPVDQAAFARRCVTAAYDAGAAEVIMYWKDNDILREKYLRADNSVFDTVPEYLKEFRNSYALAGASILSIRSNDPNLYDGVDIDRIARTNAAEAEAYAVFNSLKMNMELPWSIGAVPNEEWAVTVFPDLTEDEAVAALWDAILKTVFVSGDGTASEKWQEHLDTLTANTSVLNNCHFQYLHYSNSLGTDLTIELSPSSRWISGRMITPDSRTFVPNLPTEESFTAPKKTGSHGVVCSSLPLCLDGTIITNIRFVIEDGRIVSAEADTGEEVLRKALEMDENACYLGEIALVPYDSPISNMGLLFYNTLFDENAACHIAFGGGYAECIEGGQSMTPEALAAAGLNSSSEHVDFMIGTSDLKIVGTTFSGEEIVIFQDGNYSEFFS